MCRIQTAANPKYSYSSSLLLGAIGISSLFTSSKSLTAQANSSTDLHNDSKRDPHPDWQAGNRLNLQNLPTFTRQQVMEHNTSNSLWLTYRDGVYDLTSFTDDHPGSVERLLLACEGNHDISSWWQQLGYHNVSDVHYLLETFRIGNIDKNDIIKCEIKNAEIDPILRKDRHTLNDNAFSYEPFIAETPINILNEYFYTPSDYHYVRNHYPVPMHLDWDSTFKISGIGIPNNCIPDDDEYDDEIEEGYVLKYLDILSLPFIIRDVYLQCGGHRRIEYNAFGKTKGSKWNIGALSNGKYKGVLLSDLLKHIGCDIDKLYNDGNVDYHVWFIGADCGPDGEPYGVSIPLYKALDRRGDVMLAYEYNGKPLTYDHGYPVRMIVPGWVGARSVKWIENIIIADKECDLKTFTKSYRMTKGFKIEMRDLPVNSSIHYPQNGDIIKINQNINGENILTITGEAHSGDGKPIIRVDVSVDGGKIWNEANIFGENNRNQKRWQWTKWKCDINMNEYVNGNDNKNNSVELEIVCRAMDLSHNRQPDNCRPDLIFNPKGYSANCYHTINVNVEFE